MNLEGIKNSDISQAIDEYIHSSRDRLILKMRLIDGCTFIQISDILYMEHKIQLSERQVKNVVYKARKELFEHWDINKT